MGGWMEVWDEWVNGWVNGWGWTDEGGGRSSDELPRIGIVRSF